VSTVLIIEDQFIVSYELECLLKEQGYGVQHVATQRDALDSFQVLSGNRELAAVICDNRLIRGVPAAASLYQAIRARDKFTPFIVYSGYPPQGLPQDDPYLKIVRKPCVGQVVAHVGALASSHGKGRAFESPLPSREVAA
jgi:CheY-like chemotaxis protein